MLDLNDYLDRLASSAPTPGGGSAATVVAACGAALVAMVARITAEGKKYQDKRSDALAIAAAADDLRSRLLAARIADEAAFGAVVTAQALPKDTDEARALRKMQLQHALIGAAEAPLEAAGLAAECATLAARVDDLGNAHLESDVECAFAFAQAALRASIANVRINHQFIDDRETVEAQAERLAAIVAIAAQAQPRAAG